MTLQELLATGEPFADDAAALAWLLEPVSVPRVVMVSQLRNYLVTQLQGTGLGQRAAWDAIREYAEAGTVAGASAGENAPAARRSSARGILEMLRYGGPDEGWPVDDAGVRAQFVAIGPDNSNGPGVLTNAQLQAIDALAVDSLPRWQAESPETYTVDPTSQQTLVAAARAG